MTGKRGHRRCGECESEDVLMKGRNKAKSESAAAATVQMHGPAQSALHLLPWQGSGARMGQRGGCGASSEGRWCRGDEEG